MANARGSVIQALIIVAVVWGAHNVSPVEGVMVSSASQETGHMNVRFRFVLGEWNDTLNITVVNGTDTSLLSNETHEELLGSGNYSIQFVATPAPTPNPDLVELPTIFEEKTLFPRNNESQTANETHPHVTNTMGCVEGELNEDGHVWGRVCNEWEDPEGWESDFGPLARVEIRVDDYIVSFDWKGFRLALSQVLGVPVRFIHVFAVRAGWGGESVVVAAEFLGPFGPLAAQDLFDKANNDNSLLVALGISRVVYDGDESAPLAYPPSYEQINVTITRNQSSWLNISKTVREAIGDFEDHPRVIGYDFSTYFNDSRRPDVCHVRHLLRLVSNITIKGEAVDGYINEKGQCVVDNAYIAEYRRAVLCPDGCFHGSCHYNTCVCDPGFVGDDCKNLGIRVGTAPGKWDVVLDGEVLPAWRPDVAAVTLRIEGSLARFNQSGFLDELAHHLRVDPNTITVSDIRRGSVVLSLLFEGPRSAEAVTALVHALDFRQPWLLDMGVKDVVPNSPMITSATGETNFFLWAIPGMDFAIQTQATADPPNVARVTATPKTLRAGGPELSVTYDCLPGADGTASIALHLAVPVLKDPITLRWSKTCGPEFRPGLSVGTASTGDAAHIVAKDGQISFQWSRATLDERVIPHEIESSTFYFSLDDQEIPSQVIGRPQLVYASNVTNTTLVGPVSKGVRLDNTHPQELDIKYGCLERGGVDLALRFPIEGYRDLNITLHKECDGHRDKFTVGTHHDLSDVVESGTVQPLWAEATFDNVRGATRNGTVFFLHTEGQDEDCLAQRFAAPVVTCDPPELCAPTTAGNASEGGVACATPFVLEIYYNCMGEGTADVAVSVKLNQGEKPLIWKWKKICKRSPRKGFNVGTGPAFINVAHDGIVVENWREPHPHHNATHLETRRKFFIWSDAGVQQFAIPLVTCSDGICEPTTVGDAALGGVATENPSTLTLDYNCVKAGRAVVTVTVEPGHFEPLVWKWIKECHGTKLPALQIGTEPTIADVVHNGNLVWEGSLDVENVSVSATNSTGHNSFFLWLDPQGEQLFAPRIDSSDENIVTAVLEGPGKRGGTLTGDTRTRLDVIHYCHTPGRANFTLSIDLDLYNTYSWTWDISCLGGYRKGWAIGTQEEMMDVVMDGRVQLAWLPDSHVHIVDVSDNFTTFYMWLFDGEQLFYPPHVRSDSELLGVSLSPPAREGGILTETATPLVVNYECRGAGRIVVTVDVAVDLYRSASFSWTKLCGGTFRHGFHIGTGPEKVDVVRDGAVEPAYSVKYHSTVARVDEDNTTFCVWTDAKPTVFSAPVLILSDHDSVTLDPELSGLAALGGTTSRECMPLMVTYNCGRGSGRAVVTISLDLEGDMYPPVVFSFAKECGGGPRTGLEVGTEEFDWDVARDGVARPDWNVTHHTASVTYQNSNTSFWIWLYPGCEGNVTQRFSAPVVSSESSICSPTLSGEAAHGGVATSIPKELIVIYNCRDVGETEITVEVEFDLHSTLTWRWTKTFGGVYRGDLFVGTKPEKPDVVLYGRTAPSWNATDYEVSTGVDVSRETFYTWVDDGAVDVSSVKVIAEPASICSPTVYGEVSTTKSIMESVRTLGVEYHCQSVGIAKVTVTLLLGNYYKPVSFTWMKTCGGSVRKGFFVGTTATSVDVVFDGVVRPIWNATHHTQVSGEDTLDSIFYVMFTGQGVQRYGAPVVSATSSIVHPTLSGKVAAGGMATEEPTELVVTYNCQDAGKTDISVTMSMGLYQMITFSWTKVCGGGVRHGLNVGTETGQSDVVGDGEVLKNWSTENKNRTQLIHYGNEELATRFFAWLSGGGSTQKYSLRVSSYPAGIANPEIITSEDRQLTVGTTDYLDVVYHCIGSGDVRITVDMSLDLYNTIHFHWIKECRVFAHGLSVGTNVDGSDVVLDGRAQQAYSLLHHTAVASARQLSSTFIVSLAKDTVAYRRPVVSVHPAHIVRPVVVGSFVDNTELGDTPLTMNIQYNCLARGVVTMTVEVELEHFETVAWRWTKKCGGVAATGFNVGTVEKGTDVVSDGVTHADWTALTHNHNVEAAVGSSQFYLHSSATPVTVGKAHITAFPLIMEPELLGSGAQGGELGDDPMNLEVVYNCKQPGEAHMTMTIDLGIYLAASFTWTKTCTGSARVGLQVGTCPGGADVVRDGVATLDYNLTHHTALVDERKTMSSFFIWMNDGTFAHYGMPLVHVLTDILDVRLRGGASFGGRASEKPMELVVDYICHAPGDVAVTILFAVDQYWPVQFTFTKRCIGTKNEDFQVGTGENLNDVVMNGLTRTEWNVTHHTAVVPTEHDYTIFYLHMSSPDATHLKYAPPEVHAPSDYVNLKLKGDASTGGLCTSDASELVIQYECLRPGPFTVTVMVHPEGYDAVAWAYTKECTYARRGFNVGTEQYTRDVVKDGKTEHEYSLEHHTAILCKDEVSYSFFIHMSPNTGTQNFTRPVVTVHPTDALKLDLRGGAANGGKATEHTLELSIGFECVSAGAHVVTVTIDLTPYESVTWVFKKLCGDVIPGFDVGTVIRSNNVVHDGEVQPGWEMNNHTLGMNETEWQFRSQMKEGHAISVFELHKERVFIGVEHSSTQFFLAIHEGHKERRFGRPTLTTYPPDALMEPTLKGDAANGGVLTGMPLSLAVEYNCKTQGTADVIITLPVDNARPVRWAWKKMCFVARDGLNIGMHPHSTEVAKDGVVREHWEYTATKEMRTTIFYIHMGGEKGFADIGSPVVTSEHTDIVKTTVSGGAKEGKRVTYNPLELHIHYECVEIGVSEITVKIPVAMYEDLAFTYTKQCGSLDDIGLDVGTKPHTGDVVYDGHTRPAWEADCAEEGKEVHPEKLIPAREEHVSFYVGINNGTGVERIPFEKPTVCVSDDTAMRVELQGSASTGGVATQDPRELSVCFHCIEDAEAVVTVRIPLVETDTVVAFAFVKRCESHNRKSFTVETDKGDLDVVRDGHTLAPWMACNMDVVTPANVSTNRFFLRMAPEETDDTQVFGEPAITASSSICHPVLRGPVSGGVARALPVELAVEYNCESGGETNITLTLPLDSQWNDVKIHWRKQCSPGGVFVGTQPGWKDVVSGTRATPAYDMVHHSAVAESDEAITSFWFTTANDVPQAFTEPQVSYDEDVMNLFSLEGEAVDGGEATRVPKELKIPYECKRAGTSVVTVSFKVGKDKTDVSFRFVKRCGGEHLSLLDVGTTPGGFDVIHNGYVLHAFQKTSVSYVVPADEDVATFWLHMAGGRRVDLRYRSLKVDCSPSDIVNCLPGGNISNGGVLGEASKDLSIHFECMGTGSALVTVSLDVPLYNQLSFFFLKNCGEVTKAVKEASKHSEGTFTPPEMIALVMTVLVALGFLTGYIVKYAVFGLRGSDAIPLVNTFRNVRNGLLGRPVEQLY